MGLSCHICLDERAGSEPRDPVARIRRDFATHDWSQPVEFPLLLLLVMGFGMLITRAIGLPFLNAVSVVTLPWMVSVVVAVSFGGIADQILDLTWVMILTTWLATIAGAFIGRVVPAPSVKRPEGGADTVISIDRLRLKHRILVIVLATYVAFQFATMWPTIESVGGMSAIFDGGGDAYRRTVLDAALGKAQSGFGEGGILVAVITYILFIVGMSSIFTGAILWVARYRFAGIIPVALSSAISILTLQRTSVALSILLFAFGVFAVRWSKVNLQQRPTKEGPPGTSAPGGSALPGVVAGVVALGAAAWFIIFLSGSRGGRADERGIIATLGDYLLGGLAGLNARNFQGEDWAPLPAVEGGSDPSPGMGGYTFGGLWSVLARLGFPVTQTRYNLDYVPVNIFDERTIVNVAGATGEYYLDFRWAGIILISAALGLVTTLLQRRVLHNGSLAAIPALAYLLTVGTWSFFGSWFSDFRLMLLAVVGGAILTWALGSMAPGPPAKGRAMFVEAKRSLAISAPHRASSSSRR